MAAIRVEMTERNGGYTFRVTVRERGSETHHRITLREVDYQRLSSGGEATAEELVTESFRFLLERESKESILGSFDLTLIGRYFPEFEREIVKKL